MEKFNVLPLGTSFVLSNYYRKDNLQQRLLDLVIEQKVIDLIIERVTERMSKDIAFNIQQELIEHVNNVVKHQTEHIKAELRSEFHIERERVFNEIKNDVIMELSEMNEWEIYRK